MGEYGREQRHQLSRSIANSGAGSRQMKGFVDNRTSNIIQMKTLIIGKSFQNTPDARDDGKLGLGEKLTLNAKEGGEVKDGEGKGAPEFALESGTNVGQLNNNEFIADGMPGRVEFSVKRSDEGDSLKSKMSMYVIAPQNARFLNTPPNNGLFLADQAGAGFFGENTVYEPTTVSFNGLDFREGTAILSANGSFDSENGKDHKIGPSISVNEKNVEASTDDIHSKAIDPAVFSSKGAGEGLWPIPWQYSLSGKNNWQDFMIANHLQKIDDTATVTISKLNGTSTRKPSAGTWHFSSKKP